MRPKCHRRNAGFVLFRYRPGLPQKLLMADMHTVKIADRKHQPLGKACELFFSLYKLHVYNV
jgi:hypothetical protein